MTLCWLHPNSTESAEVKPSSEEIRFEILDMLLRDLLTIIDRQVRRLADGVKFVPGLQQSRIMKCFIYPAENAEKVANSCFHEASFGR